MCQFFSYFIDWPSFNMRLSLLLKIASNLYLQITVWMHNDIRNFRIYLQLVSHMISLIAGQGKKKETSEFKNVNILRVKRIISVIISGSVRTNSKHSKILETKKTRVYAWMNIFMVLFCFCSIPAWYKLFVSKLFILYFLPCLSQMENSYWKSVYVNTLFYLICINFEKA